MSVVFSHDSTSSLREKEVQPERPTQVEDFLQPKCPLRDRKTGYSAGHIRSVLELDTFGPNHSEFVEAMRMSGELPASPNYNRFVGSSPSGANSTKFDFERTSSTASSSFERTGKSEAGSRAGSRRPSFGSIDSLGSLGSLSSTCSLRMKTPSCRAEISEYSEQLHRSTPTAKRLEYSQARQNAQKVGVNAH